MTTEIIPNPVCPETSIEAYETYHRVAKVIGEVLHESYVDLLNQLANPWVLASLDFSEPEIAAFFKLLSATKITVEFNNLVEAQQTVEEFHHVLKPKLLSLIGTNLQPKEIEVVGEVRV